MKLTKERCLNALDVMCNECDEESAEILSQLIDEHFELVEENELLKRENKALADDNEMKCELNEKLSKEINELKRMMKTFK